ncbi:hypothetical protein HPG69_003725, partial [Diceros bicornis minor]
LCRGHAKESGDAGGIRDLDTALREVLKTPLRMMAHHGGGMKPQMGQAHPCVLASKCDEPRQRRQRRKILKVIGCSCKVKSYGKNSQAKDVTGNTFEKEDMKK